MREGNNRPRPIEPTFDLVLWDKLTLCGVPCKEYKVKKARIAAMKATVIQPIWEELDDENEEEEEAHKRTEKLWKTTWSVFNWKYRPHYQFEAYWRLLHKRHIRALDTTELEERHRFITGRCYNCDGADNIQHAYITCPNVREIWIQAKPILLKLLGIASLDNLELLNSEIIFAFLNFRRTLPKELRQKVILWHGSIIHAITKRREMALFPPTGPDGTAFDYDGWEEIVLKQI